MASSVSFTTPTASAVDESGIAVRDLGQNTYAVNLGFLKHNHRYQLSFIVVDHKFSDRELIYDPLQSLNFRIDVIERLEDSPGHKFTATMTAAKEKLMREKLTLIAVGSASSGDGEAVGVLKLEVNARVLGKDKGTPALKVGVKSVGIDRDFEDDSEQSDWQGFG